MGYQSKVYRKQGGDEFVVASGGKLSVESGGQATILGKAIVAGDKLSRIADAKTNYTTGELDTEAEIITAINATNTKINAILAALIAYGMMNQS